MDCDEIDDDNDIEDKCDDTKIEPIVFNEEYFSSPMFSSIINSKDYDQIR